MAVEHVDRRVLGAVRFIDRATGVPVTTPLRVEADGVRWQQNRRGDYVIMDAPGLGHDTPTFDHTTTFERPPDEPALGSVQIRAQVGRAAGGTDLGGHHGSSIYLPRRFTLRLPRNADANAKQANDWLFRPVEVALFRAPTAPTAPTWAVVRASLFRQGATNFGPKSNDRLPGVLIRVVGRSDAQVLARGISDHRGEALVAVPGVRLTNFSDSEDTDGPALASQIDVTIEMFYDPQIGDVPDPDQLEARRDELSSGSARARLASGQSLKLNLFVNAA